MKVGTGTGARRHPRPSDLSPPPSRSRARAECPLFALAALTASVLATINLGEGRLGKWKMEKADVAGETQKTKEQTAAVR